VKYVFQDGNKAVNDFELSFDAQISYSGLWFSINDHFTYRVTPDGFGSFDVTYRRRTVNSPFFAGDYQTSAVPEMVKRSWSVRVFGDDAGDLQQNATDLISWFTQDSYNLRYRVNEYQETWLCETADYSVDYSQVNAHNNQMVVKFAFSSHPTVSRDFIL
jgi:hypothetical protein